VTAEPISVADVPLSKEPERGCAKAALFKQLSLVL
jgi:hypothetical protein